MLSITRLKCVRLGVLKRYSSVLPFKLTDIGEGITEVELVKWFVKRGDNIRAFDRLCEVQSDKATVEITSRYEGVVSSLHFNEGSTVKVGSTLVDIEPKTNTTDTTSNTNQLLSSSVPLKETFSSTEFIDKDFSILIPMNNSIQSLSNSTNSSSPLETISSSSSSLSNSNNSNNNILTTPAVRKIAKEKGIDLSTIHGSGPQGRIVKEDLLHLDPISPSSSLSSPSSTLHSSLKSSSSPVINKKGVVDNKDQPSVSISRRNLNENMMSEDNYFTTTATNGNITSLNSISPIDKTTDSVHYTTAATATEMTSAVNVKAKQHIAEVDQVIPIKGIQKIMVSTMNAANKVQHMTYCDEILLDNLKQLRQDLSTSITTTSTNSTNTTMMMNGNKLSYMPLFIKITSISLKQYPMLNATVNDDVSAMTYHTANHIGIAMDTPKGLVVPIIRDVQDKSILDIHHDLIQLQMDAKAGQLKESQLKGGTFTLSNIGSIGGMYAVPVLVVPQVAIGAIGRIQIVPKYVNKQGNLATQDDIENDNMMIAPRTILPISWSADHRVIDGATIARFSNVWKQYVENPHLLLSTLK